MEELKLEYIDVDRLTPYTKNAKKHEEFDINSIMKSIRKHGMNDPIGVWGEKNIIVEGHGRMLACKRLGIKKVPCIRLDRMTDEERRSYTIAHNKTNELSGWDFTILKEELDELTKLDIDVEAIGFTNDELDRIVSQTVVEALPYEPYPYQAPTQPYPQSNIPAMNPAGSAMMPHAHPQPMQAPSDLIQDLMVEEFVSLQPTEKFSITFTFDMEHKEAVERFIKEQGKDAVVDAIVELASNYEN